MIAFSIRTTASAIAAAVLLVGSSTSYADAIKVGGSNQPTIKAKGIDSPGGQSGGTKSAPFDPVTVTFPKTSKNAGQSTGGNAFRGGGVRRR